VEPIRVLLADMPPPLREEFKQAIVAQPDMEAVGDVSASFELLVATGRTQADVVIIGLEDSELPGVCSHLLNEYPHVKILGVSADAQRALLYEVRARTVPVADVSAEGLISAVRVAVLSTRSDGR
jgi:DNA-binding NarL/FixJ family response regulator